jgi:hypothetical protein
LFKAKNLEEKKKVARYIRKNSKAYRDTQLGHIHGLFYCPIFAFSRKIAFDKTE